MAEWLLKDPRSPENVLHPSTEATLLLLGALQRSGCHFSHVLDMGCGSGLLSLAAAECWPGARITAADISQQAVADCAANLQAHGLAGRARAVRSDGFSHSAVRAQAPYGLIISNVIAEVHVRLASDIAAHLAGGGTAVLSGILAWRLEQVRQSYAATGLHAVEEVAAGEWRALALRRP